MSKRGGESLRQGPRAAPRGQAESVEKTAGTTILNFLNRAQELDLQATRQTGAPKAFDYSATIQRIAALEGLTGLEYLKNAYHILFEESVPLGAIEKIGDRLLKNQHVPKSEVFLMTEAFAKKEFFDPKLVGEAHLDFKLDDKGSPRFGGETWLKDFVGEQRTRKHFGLQDAHRVQVLARRMGKRYGPEAASTTRLLYMCMADEVSPDSTGASAADAVTRLTRFIDAREDEAQKGNGTEKNTLERMRDFLGMYADITAKVIDNAKSDRQKDEIDRASRRVLSEFLESEDFRISKSVPSNPFNVFRRMLLDDKGDRKNPWVKEEDCRDTPFDIAQFGRLITTENVTRGLVADAVSFLNNYKSALHAQETEKLLRSLDKSGRVGSEGKFLSPVQADKVAEALLKATELSDSSDEMPEEEDLRIQALKRFVGEHLIFSKDSERGMHPITALMRLIDAEKVVTKEHIRQEFVALLSDMPHLVDKKGQPLEEGPDGIQKIEIVESSLKEFLARESPYMDIPLLGSDGNRDPSLRMLVAESTPQWTGRPAPMEPRDLSEISGDRMRKLLQNFNTAKGVDTNSKRPWPYAACAVWNDLQNSYDNMLNFTRRQVERFERSGDTYATTFYPSATAAMRDVVARLLPPLTAEDYIIITNQEYDGMTEAFTVYGAQVENVPTNDRETGRALEPEEILAKIAAVVERRKREPAAAVLSSKTRFGDSVGVTGGKKVPSSHGFGRLATGFKERYPKRLAIGDRAQSVGRNDRGEEDLVRGGCDVYVNSGAKALGVENVATLSVRKIPASLGDNHWLSHITDKDVRKNPILRLNPGTSTMDIRRIAAFGIALQCQLSKLDTWKAVQIGDNRTQRDRVADHMEKLTEYAIAKTHEYAELLLTNPAFPVSIPDTRAALADANVQKQFGAEVVYPVHRKDIDYNGILTITFPNLGLARTKREGKRDAPDREEYLKNKLQREGFLIEQCLAGRNANRISFHYLHEEKDIDRLFEAIADIHVSFLKREIEAREEKDAKGRPIKITRSFDWLRAHTPNVPDTWMGD